MQDYLIDLLDRLLSEHNITFIKWDMNRNVSEPGWPDAPGDARELWVRYVQGVYRVWGTLAQRHPKVLWQSCSGGGGRVDYGMLRTGRPDSGSATTPKPTARLGIQEGFSQIMPAITMEAQVTHMGARCLLAGLSLPCQHDGRAGHQRRSAEMERGRPGRSGAELIALYKEIRPIVQLGDQYRLLPAQGGTSRPCNM